MPPRRRILFRCLLLGWTLPKPSECPSPTPAGQYLCLLSVSRECVWKRDSCIQKRNISYEDTSLARESGHCRGGHWSPALVLRLLFFLLLMQMKSNAFSVLKLPLRTRWQGGRWRARQACKHLQADAEHCVGTSTPTPIFVLGGGTGGTRP